ncbi:hypothetical protein JCM5296_007379 [Sporobolomyces johnsonii]
MRAALRATRVLRQRQSPSADPFAHHASGGGVWDRIRKAVVVNPQVYAPHHTLCGFARTWVEPMGALDWPRNGPESDTGNPLPRDFRTPEPASRPEKFSVPASQASDVAQNPYYMRDFRRAFPKTEVVTQGELAKLLIAQGGFEALPPVASAEGSSSTAVTADSPAPSLASLYNTSAAAGSFKPPTPPGPKYRWAPSAEPAPHDPNAYFPMYLASSEKI